MSTRKLLLFLSLISLTLLVVGCSNQTVEPEMSVEQLNFEDEFGGYQASNESPGFGDPELVTDADESDREYNDPILADPDVLSAVNDIAAGHYHFRVVWGQLRFNPNQTNPTDWSGSLSVNYGAEVLRRIIRFEPNQDHILPRKDRRTIEWTSVTTVHHDGIAVDIFVPPVRPIFDTTKIETTDSLGNTTIEIVVDTILPQRNPVVLDFKTGPYSRQFELRELVSLDTIVFLDDSNAVAFDAFRLDRYPCPRGFLSGAWGFDSTGHGLFRGMWMDNRGFVSGYLKGHFGVNNNGQKVFFGKWVSRKGRFEGYIRGHWGFRNCNVVDITPCHPGGNFRGLIYNSSREVIGALGGQFRVGFANTRGPGGFFQGRWKLYCPAESIIDRNREEGFE